jgi:hypothetical protein
VAVWRTDRHLWGRLLVRLALGIALLAAILVGQRAWRVSPWLDPLAASMFTVAWLWLNRQDLHLVPLPRALRRSRGTR